MGYQSNRLVAHLKRLWAQRQTVTNLLEMKSDAYSISTISILMMRSHVFVLAPEISKSSSRQVSNYLSVWSHILFNFGKYLNHLVNVVAR